MLATLIWTSSVVHAADHIVYNKAASVYGMYGSPKPWMTESKNGKKKYTWKNLLRSRKGQWLSLRTQAFNAMFVAYNKSWFMWNRDDLLTSINLYHDFNDVLYKRKKEKCNQIHSLFRRELYYVNQNWYWALDVDNVPASTCF